MPARVLAARTVVYFPACLVLHGPVERAIPGERRAEALRAEADDAADDAISSGAPIELDPLPPFERRIVHEYLRERGDVETHSEGEEPERFLVVTPRAGG